MIPKSQLASWRAVCEADEQKWDQDRQCPSCGRSIRLSEPGWMEPVGVCDVCLLELRTAVPALLDEVERCQGPSIHDDPVEIAKRWLGDGRREPDFDANPEDTASLLASRYLKLVEEVAALADQLAAAKAEVERLSKERPVRPAEEYVCTSCGATIRRWQEMEEYQHGGCGGLVRLRVEVDRDRLAAEVERLTAKVQEEFDCGFATSAELERTRAENAALRASRDEACEIANAHLTALDSVFGGKAGPVRNAIARIAALRKVGGK